MEEAKFFVGVHGVIANRGRVLLLRRSEVMPYKPGSWDLPGGHLCVGEGIEDCLIREIHEETGYDVGVERLLAIQKHQPEPYIQAFYACRLLVYKPIRLCPHEHTEAMWVTAREMATMELIPYLEAALASRLLESVGVTA